MQREEDIKVKGEEKEGEKEKEKEEEREEAFEKDKEPVIIRSLPSRHLYNDSLTSRYYR